MLELLSVKDSAALATHWRATLDISRNVARHLGLSAIEYVNSGYYPAPDGRRIDLSEQITVAMERKLSIPPDAPLPEAPPSSCGTTRVQVTNESTLAAARRLTGAGLLPLALNFANGINPGGGFMGGSRAQEENLCRSSALYQTLAGDPMYAAHRLRPRPDSTDWCILSPRVPVFRTDDGRTLDAPWLLDVITCAAPVVGRVSPAEAGGLMESRIGRILAIARAHAYRTLVLGAFGCGAFRNDPGHTAGLFRKALEGEFAGAFGDVVFAITDWSDDRRFLGPFARTFS